MGELLVDSSTCRFPCVLGRSIGVVICTKKGLFGRLHSMLDLFFYLFLISLFSFLFAHQIIKLWNNIDNFPLSFIYSSRKEEHQIYRR